MGRTALAILSTKNLLHNLEIIKQKAGKCDIIAMIKANGYGHGLRSIALRLEKKVFSLGVASIDEALALRKIGIKIPITLMAGAFEPDDLLVASCQNFHVVFHDQIQLDWLAKTYLPKKLTIWLKINTGMGRLGFNIEDAHEIFSRLDNIEQIEKPIGIMSHMGCADDLSNTINEDQLKNFRNFVDHYPNSKKTLGNSAVIFNFPGHLYDVARPGLALYGLSPIKDKSARDLGLKPVMTLQTKLMTINYLKKGQKIGYGALFECPEDMPIGIIAMGYGDGYPRIIKNGMPVLVNNVRCTIAGKVSMDMINIDLRNYPKAQVGDLVTLWGEGLPLEEVVQYTENDLYGIICSVQQRVKYYWTI